MARTQRPTAEIDGHEDKWSSSRFSNKSGIDKSAQTNKVHLNKHFRDKLAVAKPENACVPSHSNKEVKVMTETNTTGRSH